MAQPQGDKKRATPRVREHVDKLRAAGLDTQLFFDALVGLRDDTALPRPHREAIYKLIAQESFIWYLEAIRNERVDRVKLSEEVNALGAEYEAAIRKQDGNIATELAERDIGADSGRPSPRKKKAMPRKKGPRKKGPMARKKGPGPRKKGPAPRKRKPPQG